MRAVGSIVILALVLSGCSTIRNSKANPLNWFQGQKADPTRSLIPEENLLRRKRVVPYAGVPVHFITQAAMEPTLDGKILRIAGQAKTIGAGDIRIEDLPSQNDGVLRVVVKAVLPAGAPVGTEASRSIAAARFFTSQDLAGITAIDVTSANNVIRLRP